MRCILFDLDNTLIVKQPTVPARILAALAACGARTDAEDVARAYARSELWQGRQILRENATGVRMDDEEFLHHIVCIYQDACLPEGGAEHLIREILFDRRMGQYAAVPGAHDVLAALRGAGYLLGVASNNHAGIRAVLDALMLTPFFNGIAISEEVGILKPDPRILHIACRAAGASPEESVYVGDHPFDILCAHEAGMPIYWCPPNRFFETPAEVGRPDFTLSDIRELPALL